MIITLCGSARFERLFKAWNLALTLSGHTVFSLAAYPSDHGGKDWYTQDVKRDLDQAHIRKIEASNAIFVLNRYGYIGESTLREVTHARSKAIRCYFLESWGKGYGIGLGHTAEVRMDMTRDGLPQYSVSPIDTTTRTAGTVDPWASDLLGPAGPRRSWLVGILEDAARPK